MAYLRELPAPRCPCGKPARFEVVNRVNAPVGAFCQACGRRKLREALQREERDAAAFTRVGAP